MLTTLQGVYRKGKICPSSIWKIAARKLDQVDSVTALSPN